MSDAVDGVDLDVLATWMDAAGPRCRDRSRTSTSIEGGTQNVLLRFTRDGREYVFRRPPPHKRANSDDVMRREARILEALAGSDVPHPALIAACTETEPLGAVFYLMEPVAGFNATLGLPEPHRSDPAMQRRMGLSMAEALLALARGRSRGPRHRRPRPLRRLGRTPGRPVAQAARRLRRARRLPRSRHPRRRRRRRVARRPPPPRGARRAHARRLPLRQRDRSAPTRATSPPSSTGSSPRSAIRCSTSDTCSPPGRCATARRRPSASTRRTCPTTDEVIAHYAAGTDRDLSDLLWFRVLACYRLGLILEGTHAAACAGLAPKEVGDRLHFMTVFLLQQAQGLIA